MVHRLRDLRDGGESFHREVEPRFHHPKNRRELGELLSLRRDQWMIFEERNDPLSKMLEPEDPVDEEVFTMVVASPIPIEAATPEVPLDDFEGVLAPLALHNRESRLDLPSDPVRRAPIYRYAEAAFAVDEADDPLLDSWPFLLIARTRRIVTTHDRTLA